MQHRGTTAALQVHVFCILQIHTTEVTVVDKALLQPFDLRQLPNLPNLVQGFYCVLERTLS